MKSSMKEKIRRLLEEEKAAAVDTELLDDLRATAANQEYLMFELAPEIRETLNVFFREAKGIISREVLAGNYSMDILLDIVMTLMFETGYRMGLKGGLDEKRGS